MAVVGVSGGRIATDRITFDRGSKRTAVSLPRHGILAATISLALLGGWSLAAAAYMIFHDTVVAELRHGAKAAAKGYEAQIAALRDELERSRTRRIVEKAGVDERIAELGARQALLEQRHNRLSELADAGATDGAARRDPAFVYSVKPTPLDQPAAALDGAEPSLSGEPRRESAITTAEKVAAALDAVESRQTQALEEIATRADARRRTLERVYDAARLPRPDAQTGGRGGPFEPLPARALSFDRRADEVAAERAAVAMFERGLNRVPLRTPAPGSSITSGFGARVDPFLGRMAFHAGLDFEGDLGEAVKATAAGRVASAGWSGGYGNMVEIDHGGGLSTRFGHLSAIAVREGDEVRIGSVLGRVGSTGRSTGPHIHYETRVNGEAVDPLRFLNAGRILARAR
ncbi:M23 family metallopeptidase [Hansschlegelia zhihuaiae]|uniref:M23 family metallopeptidase n=2 Tax=Hansschlegelia zhihuaiae TaxID=405005 RepID=A0A4Q0MJW4_9HYPH|nr:M23 family metallopeptidase [Hansschlegelia zhihuaiae]